MAREFSFCGTNHPPATRDQFINAAIYSRKFEGVSSLDAAAKDRPRLYKLAIGLIECGEVAWGNPEFEKSLRKVLYDWAASGLLIRTQLFAEWLLTTTDDPESQRWLADFARGHFWGYLNSYEFKCSIVGSEQDFLYPLRLDRLIHARNYWAAYRATQRATLRFPEGRTPR